MIDFPTSFSKSVKNLSTMVSILLLASRIFFFTPYCYLTLISFCYLISSQQLPNSFIVSEKKLSIYPTTLLMLNEGKDTFRIFHRFARNDVILCEYLCMKGREVEGIQHFCRNLRLTLWDGRRKLWVCRWSFRS